MMTTVVFIDRDSSTGRGCRSMVSADIIGGKPAAWFNNS